MCRMDGPDLGFDCGEANEMGMCCKATLYIFWNY